MDKPSLPPIPRSVFWLVLWSFVLQVAMIGAFRQYRTRPIEDHFAFGWEMGRVARSIALGQGFSNPYGGNTGATAWEPAALSVSDGRSFQDLWHLHLRLRLGSADHQTASSRRLQPFQFFLIAGKTFGNLVARWSAWGWALNPYIWVLVDSLDMGHHLHPLVLSLIFLVALELQEWRGFSGLDDFCGLVGCGCVSESIDARLFAVLRPLDMAAKIQE